MKIVINTRHGGFGLSEEAEAKYKGILNITDPNFYPSFDCQRNCPVLISLVEEMGDQVNSVYSRLKVIEIPDDVDWYIEEFGGREWIAEVHRTRR